jgi:hypothetical protein
MPTFGRRKLMILVVLALCASMDKTQAVLLDWSTVTWPAGTLNNSFDVDPGSPGNDVTVAVTGDTSQLLPSFSPPNEQTPVVTQTFQGGFGSPQSSLELRVDFTNQSQFVTVTITFAGTYAAGVNNLSLILFDIDNQGTYQDEIRSITALSTDGITQIAPTISGLGSAVALSGTGLNQTLDGIANCPDTGVGSGDGNATINFGATPIQSFTFTYGSGSATQADPTTQKIGIFNLDYMVVPVPEINPAVMSSVFCLLAIGFHYVRTRRRT